MNGRNISEEGSGVTSFGYQAVDDPQEDTRPVAQPEDYAAEDVGETNFADIEPEYPEKSTETDPSWLRQNCLSLAVQSLGPERPDSGANWAEDTIRRSEQFLKYIKNGVRE